MKSSYQSYVLLPRAWVDDDVPGVVEVFPQQNGPHAAVKVGHLNTVIARVSPVQLATGPVQCQASWTVQTCAYHNLSKDNSHFREWQAVRIIKMNFIFTK